jgi:hypothetical protein
MSGSQRRFEAAARRRSSVVAHRWRLDEVPVLASYALLVSAAALAGAWWYFTPLILALLNYIPNAATKDLALLSPDFITYHNYYRGTFSFVVILSVAAWYPVLRLVKKGQSPPWGLMAGGLVAVCVALALLHLPYRLLYFTINEPFEAARLNGTECSVIGEDGNRVLLFCPLLDAPRNRVVMKGDPALVQLGVRRNIFTPLVRQASR